MPRKSHESINTASNNKKKLIKWLTGIIIVVIGTIIAYFSFQLSDKEYQDSHIVFQDSQKKPAFDTIVIMYSYGPVKALYEGNNLFRLEILESSRYDVEIINIGNSSAHDVQINIAPIASEYPVISTFPITNITKIVENHILYITTPVLGAGSSITFQIKDVLPDKDKPVSYLFGDSWVPAFQVNIWCKEGVTGGLYYNIGLGNNAGVILKHCTLND